MGILRSGPRVFVRPIPIKHALKFNADVHRRQPKLQGGMWAIAAEIDGATVGVAIVGHPQARMAARPGVLEVLRCAVLPQAKNACSALYGACSRAARAMGADDLFTYIHGDESGHSLKAAGWVPLGETGGGEWSRDGRQRKLSIDPKPKRKWGVAWGPRTAAQLDAVGL